MSWETLSPELRDVIERVCTPRQVEVLTLLAQGHSIRSTARLLGVSHQTVQDHLAAAERKIRGEVAAMRGVQP